MEKKVAVTLFGTQKKLAEALGITPQAVSAWPDQLDQRRADQVIGAAVRLGLRVPDLRPGEAESA